MHINNIELFKLAAINMPKGKLLPLMPCELQCDSTDLNRMRSKYISLLLSVWKAYAKFIFGTTCSIMGTFTMAGDFIPSLDLCEACGAPLEINDDIDASKYPVADYGQIAQMAGWGTAETV